MYNIFESNYLDRNTLTKICIYGSGDHALNVYGAFTQALGDCGIGWSGTVVYGTLSIADALILGCQLYIKSMAGLQGNISSALANYPMQVFMPAGSNTPNDHIYNSNGILPSIIVTGAGDGSNETGYDIEFYSNDPITPEATPDEQDLSSFSNGYIAGLLTYICNTLDVNMWTARYLCRMALGNSWTPQNGYGKLTPQIAQSAINLYDPEFDYGALDPRLARIGTAGTLSAIRTGQSVSITLESVTNATTYEIRKDGVLLSAQSGLTFTDTISQAHVYDYRAKFTNAYGVVEWSDYSQPVLVKYVQFNAIIG